MADVKSDPNNPPGNVLAKGTTNDMVEDAVRKSGYPVQTEVAVALLERELDVYEEWSYPDRDSAKLRAIDVAGLKQLGDESDTIGARLALLIECKRSGTPYVFFRSATDRQTPDFPAVYALDRKGIDVSVTGKGSSNAFAARAFGLDEMPFVAAGPPMVSTFAKTELKGDKALLSGEDVYSGILMPLIGAMDQASEFVVGWHSGGKAHPALTLGLCVLDAPMILADARKRPHDLSLTPWVRITRHEIITDPRATARRTRFYAFDIVHLDFFSRFLDEHLLPFAEQYAQRVKQMTAIIQRGQAQAPHPSWKWSDLTST
jgi:hypothetical protein